MHMTDRLRSALALALPVCVLATACSAKNAGATASQAPTQAPPPRVPDATQPTSSPTPQPAAEPQPSPPADVPAIVCNESFGPVELDKPQADARYGINAKKFSSVPSSKKRPIEVCGIDGQLSWLTATQCDDGSNPFSTANAAHGARRGSIGPGGRCGNILDLYAVQCPEGTYYIHLDMYMCGPR